MKNLLTVFLLLLSACSVRQPELTFLESGSIIISKRITPDLIKTQDAPPNTIFGFTPPFAVFTPQESETWVELNKEKHTLSVYRGRNLIKEMDIEGELSVSDGTYPVQVKRKRLTWNAPDDYFTKRNMPVPPQNDKSRFLRGAYGAYAIRLNEKDYIHSAPMLTSEIGGVRLKRADFASIYYMIPVGANVVVK